ncbi:hypothetical protein WJX77_009944 [Trebouxia sp. C0004]
MAKSAVHTASVGWQRPTTDRFQVRGGKPRLRQPSSPRCSATAPAAAVAGRSSLLSAAVEKLFNFPPVYAAAVAQARNKITQRGAKLGIDFNAEVAKLRAAADWGQELQATQDPGLQLPAYYQSSFHAYQQGNLCWEAAWEANMVSQFVHATVMDPERKHMDPEGDAMLRSNYSTKLKQLMHEACMNTDVRHAVDLGCSTGLSTLELHRSFPEAQITAVDLSPYFITVAKHDQRHRQLEAGNTEPIHFRHAAAEATNLPDSSQNLVSACLLFHELPQSAAQNIVREAFRILKPGGVLSIMEMNPASPSFKVVLGNPIAYAAFKSTEPWLLEYMALDLGGLAQSVGFVHVAETSSTPCHKTFVACKSA